MFRAHKCVSVRSGHTCSWFVNGALQTALLSVGQLKGGILARGGRGMKQGTHAAAKRGHIHHPAGWGESERRGLEYRITRFFTQTPDECVKWEFIKEMNILNRNERRHRHRQKELWRNVFVCLCPEYQARTLKEKTKTTSIYLKCKPHLSSKQQSQAKVVEQS